MLRLSYFLATAALLASANTPGIAPFKPTPSRLEFPAGENLPVLPDMSQVPGQDSNQASSSTGTTGTTDAGADQKPKEGPLTLQSRLALVRFIDGEFARVVVPIPAGKKGFHLRAGIPVDQDQLRLALGGVGAAVNPGDTAQITSLEFKDREIMVDINGGGKGKTKLRDRIHLEVNGLPTAQPSDPVRTVSPTLGATLLLDFDGPVPDLSPDDLKSDLSGILDFSHVHSAAVQWIDTLPPDIQNAIKDKRPVLGMDHEMVLAAMGRPDRKVRERTPDGDETEDWIYGTPPAKTVFVTFEGEKVIQVREFPH